MALELKKNILIEYLNRLKDYMAEVSLRKPE